MGTGRGRLAPPNRRRSSLTRSLFCIYCSFFFIYSFLSCGCIVTRRIWQPDHPQFAERILHPTVDLLEVTDDGLLHLRLDFLSAEDRVFLFGQNPGVDEIWLGSACQDPLPMINSLKILAAAGFKIHPNKLLVTFTPNNRDQTIVCDTYFSCDFDPTSIVGATNPIKLPAKPKYEHSLNHLNSSIRLIELAAWRHGIVMKSRLFPVAWRRGTEAINFDLAILQGISEKGNLAKNFEEIDDVEVLLQTSENETFTVPLPALIAVNQSPNRFDRPNFSATIPQAPHSAAANSFSFSHTPIDFKLRKTQRQYDTGKTIGRVAITPLGVAADVVVIATAPIWGPVYLINLGKKLAGAGAGLNH